MNGIGFKVYTPTAGTMTIETHDQYCEVDTVVEIYDETLTLIGTNDDCYQCACGPCPCLYGSRKQIATTAGKYYFVKVREYSQAETGVWEIHASLSTSHDVGDTKTAAWYIPEDASGLKGRRLASDFESGNDVDWFKIWLNEREFVAIETYGLEPGCDTVTQLWDDGTNGYQRIPDAAKRWMVYDDDGAIEYKNPAGQTIEPYASHAQFVAPRAGYYFARVSPYSSSTIGSYFVQVVRLSINAQAYPTYP